jgi:hypothetical protein
MAYSLSLSNGNYIPGIGAAGLQDGTVNSASTSLSLVGKNYPGYGTLLNENFVFLLENFANTTSPSAALPGQLWWDSGNNLLKVNTAAAAGDLAVWKSLASVYSAAPITDTHSGAAGTPENIPYKPNMGDLWWDTANLQLKLYTTVPTVGYNGWITIGPANNTTSGQTGATPDTILDTSNIPRVVIKFYVSNELIGVLNGGASFNTQVPGFSEIRPGFNLSTVSNYMYNGTATSASSLLIGNVTVPASNFARTDIPSVSNVGLSTSSSDGIKIGPLGDLVLDLDSSGNGRIRQTASGKNVTIYVNNTGVQTPVFVANGASGTAEVTSSPVSANGIANKFYVDNTVSAIQNYVATNTLMRDGSNTITGALVPASNVAISLGSTTAWFANIYGQSMQAQYADLAERFAADAEYAPGTVVEIGGAAEITAVSADLSENVFGVISTNAAYLMNASSGDDTTHPPVALSGRVPVNVIGKVSKGDRLVSAGNGCARAALKTEITPWNVIGRALEDKETDGFGLLEAIVKINN